MWAIVRHENSEVYHTVLGDWRKAYEDLMPKDQQMLPSCVLVDNSNAEINASRSACTRVFMINKLLPGYCSTYCPCIYCPEDIMWFWQACNNHFELPTLMILLY